MAFFLIQSFHRRTKWEGKSINTHQAAGIDECLFLDAFGLDADFGDVAFSHQ